MSTKPARVHMPDRRWVRPDDTRLPSSYCGRDLARDKGVKWTDDPRAITCASCRDRHAQGEAMSTFAKRVGAVEVRLTPTGVEKKR